MALEDACLTNKDLYLTYIDFKNDLGSVDHARLLVLMEDLGYPQDTVELIGNITQTPPSPFKKAASGQPHHISIKRVSSLFRFGSGTIKRHTKPLPIHHFPRATPK